MIENYLLHEQIGQGEYGKVYRATDISTQTTFAVKVVETQKLNENPKLLDLSLTEIKVLQTVSHCPYIIHFIQLIKTPIKYYFVYEYCAGGPLDKMLSL
jgi:serine/threonine protein kinase